MSTDIRVALIYQQEAGCANLRTALANAGVAIAIECKADALDKNAIVTSGVDAIVVNLDIELEDLLDQVTEALDSAPQPVMYNDPAASSDLSGWDRARWLRHLSAKLKGRTDATPPAPPGSSSIPTPAPKAVAKPMLTPIAEPVVEQALAAPVAATIADQHASSASFASESTALDFSALDDLLFQAESTESATPVVDDLDALFEADASVPKPTPSVADSLAADDLDALFADSTAADATPSPPATHSGLGLELEALFDAEPAPPVASPAVVPVVSQNELADLDALFEDFAASAAEAPAAKPGPSAPEPKPAAVDLSSLSLDWSLEPFDEPEVKPKTEKVVAEWRLDAPSKPVSAEAPVVRPPEPTKAPSGPKVPDHLEQSLALSDFSLLDDFSSDPAPVAAKTNSDPMLEDLGALDLSGIDFGGELSFDDGAHTSAASGSQPRQSLAIEDSELDFAIDLGDLGQSSAGPSGASFDAELGDLDSLFEPAATTPVIGLSLPDLNRVFVLGASIGGPEAIKAFLGKLPSNVPAAFIVAQHMGAEFLQMMAAQLDAATPLTVRFPQNGERLRHGQVIVAPATERIAIDESGSVRFSAAPASPYNPSIDQLVRDAVDRFGDQVTLILFSGMGNDAVEGGRYLTERGGQVWAQDRATCVIASMIEAAKSQGLIRFEGNPAQLAERVLQVLS